MNDIPQDMFILCLLKHVPKKSKEQQKLFCKLAAIYVDYERYEKELIHELECSTLITKLSEKELICKKSPINGSDTEEKIEVNKVVYCTNEKGVLAINNDRYSSETKAIRISKWNMYVSNTATTIAIIGGVLGISSAVYTTCTKLEVGNHEQSIIEDSNSLNQSTHQRILNPDKEIFTEIDDSISAAKKTGTSGQ